MKKIRSLLATVLMLIMICSLLGCDMQWGSKYITDPKEYGKWESYLDIPSFLPSEIDEYKVNSYSYTLLAYFDICYEIFVDISVTEEQFNQLINNAKANPDYLYEKDAYYSDGYKEIVFQDYYKIYHREDDVEPNVGWADIEKVVYNPETLNIIYVSFHANDTGVYYLDEVEYFNRFSIQEADYFKSIRRSDFGYNRY